MRFGSCEQSAGNIATVVFTPTSECKWLVGDGSLADASEVLFDKLAGDAPQFPPLPSAVG